MDLPILVFTLGTIPLYASRVFAPTFWLALLARFQSEGAFALDQSWGPLSFDFMLAYPAWLIQDGTLLFLGLLALLEMMADKNPDLAQMFALFDSETKAFGNFMANSVVNVQGQVAFLAALSAGSGYAVYSGFDAMLFWTALVGSGVWLVSKLRSSLVSFLIEMDEDDDLGLRKVISWAEDGGVGLGVLFLVLFPLLALAVSGITVLMLYLVRRYLEARDETQKIACQFCSSRNYPTAVECFHCRRSMPAPRRTGVLGQATAHRAGNLDQHRLRLLTRRRCFVCATRLPKKAIRQACPACSTEVFPSTEWARIYLDHLRAKLSKTLLICTGLSLIPFLGLIPGIVYYRLSLISSLRNYIPLTTGCLTRWMVRLINIVLLAFQWVPFLGAVTLPLMCLINYSVYKKVVDNEIAKHLLTAPDGVPDLPHVGQSGSPAAEGNTPASGLSEGMRG